MAHCEAYFYSGFAEHRNGATTFATHGRKRGYQRCRSTALTHQVSSGCEHEHVRTWLACFSCAAAIARRRRDGSPGQCVTCSTMAECGPGCRVFITVGALEPAMAAGGNGVHP
jgi:hypothetical protein